jgi:hypothetical protein
MKARLDLSAPSQAPHAPQASRGEDGRNAAAHRSGPSSPSDSLREVAELLAQLERLNDLRKLMDETIRLYYWINFLTAAQQRSLGIHELLFPQYWKKPSHGAAHAHGSAQRPSPGALALAALAARHGHGPQACRPPAAIPPLVGVALNARPPIAPIPLSAEQLSKLPPPPLPDRLRTMLEHALTTPWSPDESMEHFQKADRDLSAEAIQEALGVLPELEAALGMPLRKTPNGNYGTRIDVASADGFERLAAERFSGKSSATGAYLHRLVALYQDYKAEYYGLSKAIDRDLYHRDPCSHRPPVRREDALRYLEDKYAVAMEGVLWRAARTSSPVMLDLDGDGQLAVTGRSTAQNRAAGNGFVAAGSVSFDLDGDGQKERIEWMAGDGMLVDDRDGGASLAAAGDGEIDGKRLFGDEGGKYANGYQKLQALDADRDGRLTGSELDGLKVWVDDGDARLQAGELKTMAELGVSEIDTRMTRERTANGESLMRSTFVQHGETKVSEDAWFARG